MNDYRDIALSHIMADLVAAEARIASLVADVQTYRELTIAAFDSLRDLGIYAHVLPSMQQDAAARIGVLLRG